jgi:uncharacterized protein
MIGRMLILSFALLVASCADDGAERPARGGYPTTGAVRIESRTMSWDIDVEIAPTPATRTRGLMGRTFLPPDRGMLFLYPEPGPRGFWMKGCLMPIDAAYVAEDGRIVNIAEMAPEPGVEYPTTHPSDAHVRIVLEMAGGWFREHGVESGDRVVVPAELLSLEPLR